MKRSTVIASTAAGLVAGLVLGAGVTGVATADHNRQLGGPGMSQDQGPGKQGKHGMRGQRGERGQMLHSERVVKLPDGSIVTYRNVHGSVTAVTPDSLTVRAEDGYVATFTVTPQTVVGAKRSPGTIADIAIGSSVGVMGRVNGSTATAERIMAHPAR